MDKKLDKTGQKIGQLDKIGQKKTVILSTFRIFYTQNAVDKHGFMCL